MRTTSLIGVITLSTLIVLGEFASAQSTQRSDLVPVTISTTPQLYNAPVYIAAEEGFFVEEGIEAVFLTVTSPRMAFPALANGDIDVQVSGIIPGFFNSVERAAKVRIVAGGYTPSSGDCISSAICATIKLIEDGSLKSPKDMIGKRVGADPSSWVSYIYDTILAKDEKSLEDIEIIHAPLATRVEGLQKGLYDITYLVEPQLTVARDGGGMGVWISITEIFPTYQANFVLYGSRLLEEQPELGKKFLVAYLRGVEQYSLGKTPRNIEILAKITGLTPEFLQRVCWPAAEKTGAVMIDYIRGYQEWCVKNKLSDSVLSTDKLWDEKFLEYAKSVLQKDKK